MSVRRHGIAARNIRTVDQNVLVRLFHAGEIADVVVIERFQARRRQFFHLWPTRVRNGPQHSRPRAILVWNGKSRACGEHFEAPHVD